MQDTALRKQARVVSELLPPVMRHLLSVHGDPAGELPMAQLRVCGILYHRARSMSAIGRELGVSLSAMTQIADRLERARLVRRVAKGSDRRVRWLQLTERGERLMRRREDAHTERVLELLERLPQKSRRAVLNALKMLSHACEGAHDDGPCSDLPLNPPHLALEEALT